MGDTMKAVNYQGAFKVKVEDVPKPKIEHPDDIIVKVTTAGECFACPTSSRSPLTSLHSNLRLRPTHGMRPKWPPLSALVESAP